MTLQYIDCCRRHHLAVQCRSDGGQREQQCMTPRGRRQCWWYSSCTLQMTAVRLSRASEPARTAEGRRTRTVLVVVAWGSADTVVSSLVLCPPISQPQLSPANTPSEDRTATVHQYIKTYCDMRERATLHAIGSRSSSGRPAAAVW